MLIDFSCVKRLVAIEDVLRLLDFVENARSGDQVRGPCPVHRSGNPRSRNFSANLRHHYFRCFSCGQQGNALELYALATCQPFHKGVIELLARLKIPTPFREPTP